LYNPTLDNSLPSSWAASTNAPDQGTPGVQNSVFTTDQPPTIDAVTRDIGIPSSTDTPTITGLVTDNVGLSSVELFVDSGSGFVSQPMFDDGLHGDGFAGDFIYGSTIVAQPSDTLVRYYLSATDTAVQTVSFPLGAPTDYRAYTVDHQLPTLVVNEVLASNLNGATDEFGEAEDWVEIRNWGTQPV